MAGSNPVKRINIRYFNLAKDYGMIASWWKAHGSDLIAPKFLPPTGIITEIENQAIAAGFLYRTDSGICVFEFVVVNPKAVKAHRGPAVDALIEAAEYWAKQNGFGLICTWTGVETYISRLQKKAFKKADKNQTHMFREVV